MPGVGDGGRFDGVGHGHAVGARRGSRRRDVPERSLERTLGLCQRVQPAQPRADPAGGGGGSATAPRGLVASPCNAAVCTCNAGGECRTETGGPSLLGSGGPRPVQDGVGDGGKQGARGLPAAEPSALASDNVGRPPAFPAHCRANGRG
jgi:hypothetical protein